MRTNTVTEEVTSLPVSFDSTNSVYYSDDSTYPISNGYTDTNSTTYARINLTRDANAETFIYYNFGFNIPSNATINSVVAKTKEYISSTNSSRVTTRQVQLFSGGVAKGSSSKVTSAATVHTLNLNNVTWTAEEINNLQVRLYAKRGTSNTTSNYYFRFYGAELTVNYTYNQIIYEVTSQSDVTGVSISPSSADITAGGSRTFEILGDLTNVIVEDNSIDVTSQLVIQTGGSVSATYSLTNVSEDHFIHFYLRGNKIFIKRNGSWVEASDIKVKLNGTWQSVSKVYKKENGAWEEQDKSAMFDPNALYIKG